MLPYPIPLRVRPSVTRFRAPAQICDHQPEAGTDAVDADRALRSSTAVSVATFCIAPARRWTRPIRSMEADRGRLDLWPKECERIVASATGRSVIATSGGTALRLRFGPDWVTHSVRTCQPRAPGPAAQTSGAIVRDAPAGSSTLLPSSNIAASMQQTQDVRACQVRRQVSVDLAAARTPTRICCSPGPFARDMRSSAGLVRTIGSCRPCS